MTKLNRRLTQFLLNVVLFTGVSFATFFSTTAHATPKPIALVWKGPGACWPDCWPEATNTARRAGFQVKFVTPSTTDFSIFDNAKLWVQPGGKSKTASLAMGSAMRDRIRQFVADGGGYVGFCAGMFLATHSVGTTDQPGLGLFPGTTKLYKDDGKSNDHAIYEITMKEGNRFMYYAGGPYLDLSASDATAAGIDVVGYYPNGTIAALRTTFGKGRVAVTGFHPEIGDFWKSIQGFPDPDGSDKFFAEALMKYAAGTTP